MSNRVELHPCYILHTRAYRDTSLLADILTQEYGKITLVAKGARRANNRQRYLLQPFIPVLLSWQGKSSLKTLVGIESEQHTSACHLLNGSRLYSALYVNELLSYLLLEDNPSDAIYEYYQQLLLQLQHEQMNIEYCLRCFELTLLEELGYGINFLDDADTGEALIAHANYVFIQHHGFVLAKNFRRNEQLFSGDSLLAIQQRNFSADATRRSAKYLTRIAFKPLLKGRILKSRELFTMMNLNQST